MIEDTERTYINIRSSRYFIVSAAARCPVCGLPTTVIAIGVPPGHEMWVPADETEEADADAWLLATESALLFFVEHLPPAVCDRLRCLSNSYRSGIEGEDPGVWVNHCGACDAPFDDNELFCEPEGAFLPISTTAAAKLRLQWIEERITAAVGGYSVA